MGRRVETRLSELSLLIGPLSRRKYDLRRLLVSKPANKHSSGYLLLALLGLFYCQIVSVHAADPAAIDVKKTLFFLCNDGHLYTVDSELNPIVDMGSLGPTGSVVESLAVEFTKAKKLNYWITGKKVSGLQTNIQLWTSDDFKSGKMPAVSDLRAPDGFLTLAKNDKGDKRIWISTNMGQDHTWVVDKLNAPSATPISTAYTSGGITAYYDEDDVEGLGKRSTFLFYSTLYLQDPASINGPQVPGLVIYRIDEKNTFTIYRVIYANQFVNPNSIWKAAKKNSIPKNKVPVSTYVYRTADGEYRILIGWTDHEVSPQPKPQSIILDCLLSDLIQKTKCDSITAIAGTDEFPGQLGVQGVTGLPESEFIYAAVNMTSAPGVIRFKSDRKQATDLSADKERPILPSVKQPLYNLVHAIEN